MSLPPLLFPHCFSQGPQRPRLECAGHRDIYFYRGWNLEAVRQGPWKLLLTNQQLCHLDPDVGEAPNVAAEHPEIVAQLEQLAQSKDIDLGRVRHTTAKRQSKRGSTVAACRIPLFNVHNAKYTRAVL